MRNASHDTLTGILRDAVESWRKASGWSRETVVMHIVDAHERIGGPASTGIVFDPPTRDTFERAKVNADRVFRWLDDSTKDRNLIPANFIWSILAAFPEDRRMNVLDDLLAPVGFAARHVDDDADDDTAQCVVQHFRAVVEHSAAANMAMSQMLDGIDPGEPEQAKKKLSIAAATMQKAVGMVNRVLRRRRSGK